MDLHWPCGCTAQSSILSKEIHEPLSIVQKVYAIKKKSPHWKILSSWILTFCQPHSHLWASKHCHKSIHIQNANHLTQLPEWGMSHSKDKKNGAKLLGSWQIKMSTWAKTSHHLCVNKKMVQSHCKTCQMNDTGHYSTSLLSVCVCVCVCVGV